MTPTVLIDPLRGPVDLEIRVPGSKSHTNRALICAALASGGAGLGGVLRADDTEAMLRAIAGLGISIVVQGDVATVHGLGGDLPSEARTFDVGLSGTTSRFLAPILALRGKGDVLDGEEPLRRRPMGPGFAALRLLGATIGASAIDGLPARFDGPPISGGRVGVAADASSQFVSGLLMVGPVLEKGLEVELTTELVSAPYVELTIRTMAEFGAHVERDGASYRVAPSGYRDPGGIYQLEPDASAASYFFAAAAITGSTIAVPGLGIETVQGDLAFVDILGDMGAEVRRESGRTVVRGTGVLRGVDVDMRHCSDTAQTLATVAVFAEGPTRVRGIGFIRRKETDRIGHVVRELRRCGIDAQEHDDGFTVVPGSPHAATIETYDDHRMAMSFALLGLRAPGIRIADPGCVAKTYPGFWDDLALLGRRSSEH